jgi:hypothetical protein
MNYIVQISSGWGTEGSIIVRALSIAVLMIYVIPLQIRESRVKNGLRKLRIQMLSAGTIILLMNLVTLWITFRGLSKAVDFPPDSEFLQIFNASGFFGISVIFFLIYHQQFSPKQKELHKKIEIQEKVEGVNKRRTIRNLKKKHESKTIKH